MEVLHDRISKRRANKLYREFFKNIDGITFQTEPNKNYFSNYWLTTVLIDLEKTGGITNEVIRLKLSEMNVESRPLWKPMHMQPIYKNSKFYGTGFCENLFNFGLCLPSGSNLTENEFDRIFNTLSKIFK